MTKNPWSVLEYPLESYPLPQLIADALGVGSLDGLDADLPLRTWETDQQSPWHQRFYDSFPAWQGVYESLVREVVGPAVGEPFYWQAKPTFRVHLPDNVAVGSFHSDAQYHHPPGETSNWLPLTHAEHSSSVWIEDDRGTLRPPTADPGQIVLFDAVGRKHGNLVNRTGRARVSFDFRTLPVRLLPEVEGSPSEHAKLRFVPGSYYAVEAITP